MTIFVNCGIIFHCNRVEKCLHFPYETWKIRTRIIENLPDFRGGFLKFLSGNLPDRAAHVGFSFLEKRIVSFFWVTHAIHFFDIGGSV